MWSNSVCNQIRDKQIGLLLRGRPILLSLVWLQTESVDSSQSYYHYIYLAWGAHANLAIIFHKMVQICLDWSNQPSSVICALRIRFLVFNCLSNWRNYIAFVTAARINLLLPWLEVKGPVKYIFLWHIERVVSKQHHLTPLNHLVVEVKFWAMFNCLIYFLELFFSLPDKKIYQFPISTLLAASVFNWFP